MAEKVDHLSLSNHPVLRVSMGSEVKRPFGEERRVRSLPRFLSLFLSVGPRLQTLSLTSSQDNRCVGRLQCRLWLHSMLYNGVAIGQKLQDSLSWAERTGIQQTGLAPHYFCLL